MAQFNGGNRPDGKPLSWSQINDILSGKPTPTLIPHDAHSSNVRTPASVGTSTTPYAELHATSSYNFLAGAADPDAYVTRAAELGINHLALLDRDGFYGAVKTATAAKEYGTATIFGAELTLNHQRKPLPLLARSPEGYKFLSHLITDASLSGPGKGQPIYPPLEKFSLTGEVVALVDHQWLPDLEQLIATFGPDNVWLELVAEGTPIEHDHHRALLAAAEQLNLRTFLTPQPTAPAAGRRFAAASKQALKARASLDQVAGQLHPRGARWMASGDQLLHKYPHLEQQIRATVPMAEELAFDLKLIAPKLPPFDVPAGHTESSWLAELVRRRFPERYRVQSTSIVKKAEQQVAHELAVIDQIGFPGYFLIVHDIVRFCHDNDIYCQGRGSAANSVVCFILGVTHCEPISAGLLFERFLSPEREGAPDIDIDIESGRREEVIQYVYQKYGRHRAAQVANVITYRSKGATRDAGRVLGYPQGTIDAWATHRAEAPEKVQEIAEELRGQPRHLGIHSGGMVICDRPIADVVPIEWARKKDRSVIQWDKDDAAEAGLIKFDLLGLGMLEALHYMTTLVRENFSNEVKLWELDVHDPKVYEMLSRADSIGVFQVESRAQMATLPRLKPRKFFDLVVEVALIRPGPIQGGSIHPYMRRRNGEEPVTYDHPCMEASLKKTLGVPLFQEQLMQLARDVSGFSAAEADTLRRAMGQKRSLAAMQRLQSRFYEGARALHGMDDATIGKVWNKIVAFSAYGFPESHSQSFAALVYYSAWFKCHYPAQFCVGLLRAQPMGFYSPQSLIADARRHGVEILPIDVSCSTAEATCGPNSIRLPLTQVNGISKEVADRIAAAAPFDSVADCARRAELNVTQMESLARAGAFDSLGVTRRQALWQAQAAATESLSMLPGLSTPSTPNLPGMSELELTLEEISLTGVSHQHQPMELFRDALEQQGIVPASELIKVPDGTRVKIAGTVTHRQRPRTASGVIFFGLEDETGLMNVMVSPGLWKRYKDVAQTARVVIIRGIVSNQSGAVSITADKIEQAPIDERLARKSRDFR